MSDLGEIARNIVLGGEVCREPLAEAEWASLDAVVRHDRIEAYRRAAIHDGRMAATDDQLAAAEEQLFASMERTVAIEAMVGRVADLLAAQDIPLVALKGLAACRLDRDELEFRSFFDADLMVRPSDLEAAYAALVSLGFDRRFVEPAIGFDAEFGKGTAFVDAEHREIDLHRTLAMGSLGISVVIDELWEHTTPIEIAGRPVLALSPEARLLHACVHAAASTDPPRLHTLLDIREIEARGYSAERAAALISSWRFDAVVRQALALHDEFLGTDGVDTLRDVAASLRPSRLQSLTLTAYRRPGTGYASRSLLALPVIQGWRRRLRFVRALVRPNSDYVSHRHGTRRDRWQAAAGDFRALIGGSR